VSIEGLEVILGDIRANLRVGQYLKQLQNSQCKGKALVAEQLFNAKVRLSELQERLYGQLSLEEKRAIIENWISGVSVGWHDGRQFVTFRYTFENPIGPTSSEDLEEPALG